MNDDGDDAIGEESMATEGRLCIHRFQYLVDVVGRIHGTLVGEIPPAGRVPLMAAGAATS